MRKILSWLTGTEVPRWQLALGFILATAITVGATYYSSKLSIERQDNIAKTAKFRESAAQVDTAASNLVDSVIDQDSPEKASTDFRHAVIIHLRDVESVHSLANDSKLADYRSAVIAARVEADRTKSMETLPVFFLKMGEVRKSQLTILAEIEEDVD